VGDSRYLKSDRLRQRGMHVGEAAATVVADDMSHVLPDSLTRLTGCSFSRAQRGADRSDRGGRVPTCRPRGWRAGCDRGAPLGLPPSRVRVRAQRWSTFAPPHGESDAPCCCPPLSPSRTAWVPPPDVHLDGSTTRWERRLPTALPSPLGGVGSPWCRPHSAERKLYRRMVLS